MSPDGAQPARTVAVPRRDGIAQRARVGLTGLAAIFLVVLIAAASLKPGRPLAVQGPTGEPLAVLGVAPGAGQASQTTAAAPPPKPRPTRS